MLTQIKEEEWNMMFGGENLCLTRFSVQEVCSRYGIEFEQYDEYGIGTCFCAYVEVDGEPYFMRGYGSQTSKEYCVDIQMQGNNPNPEASLNAVVSALGISRSDLSWIREDLSPPSWILYRQGEDGNEFEMFRFHSKLSADHCMEKYTQRGHKQLYFVKRKA